MSDLVELLNKEEEESMSLENLGLKIGRLNHYAGKLDFGGGTSIGSMDINMKLGGRAPAPAAAPRPPPPVAAPAPPPPPKKKKKKRCII